MIKIRAGLMKGNKMPNIKFSHAYQKLLDSHNDVIKTAKLLGVFLVDLEGLHQDLTDYDTDSGVYSLPKSGIFLMLMFLKPHEDYVTDKNLFITLRRHTMNKHMYYRNLIGQTFDVILTGQE